MRYRARRPTGGRPRTSGGTCVNFFGPTGCSSSRNDSRSLHIPAARRDPGGQSRDCGRCAYRAHRNRQSGENRNYYYGPCSSAGPKRGGERMGPRVMRRLPKYVHGFVDRHGKPRFYFRRPGFALKRLRGAPYSPQFMEDYAAAMAGQPLPVGFGRARPGSVLALAISYFASPEFRTLKPSTQRAYRWTIDRICRDHGEKRAADLRREHIVRLMAARAEQPGAANALRMALRVMMKHAVDIGLRADDPTRDVRAIRVKTGGHHSWTESQIEQFERHHPVGSRARLVFALLLYTGQRRGDVLRMGAQHIRDGAVYVKQEKTGIELVIPLHPDLAAIIAAAPRDHLTFVTTRLGGPFQGSAFSRWFREQC